MQTTAALNVRRLSITGLPAVALVVGVGYIDPGNWSTDLNASRFGYVLLWAVIASGFAAIAMQVLAVRLTLAEGADLTTLLARGRPAVTAVLWTLYGIAIVATEAAEFTGIVLGLALVLHVPMPIATAIGAVMFALLLLGRGTVSAGLERLATITTAVVGSVYLAHCVLLHPPLGAVVRGAVLPRVPSGDALLAVVGIAGATIMPHNLFLHSGLIAERLRDTTARAAVRSTYGALLVATLVNAAILIVGAALHAGTIERAFATLAPAAGSASPMVFGAALVLASVAATASSARAGDMVLRRGTPIALPPVVRRLIGIIIAGVLLCNGMPPSSLLVATQVLLGIALPAVAIPLVVLAYRSLRTRRAAGTTLIGACAAVCAVTLLCDAALIRSLFPSS